MAKCEYSTFSPNADGEVSEYLNFYNCEGLKVKFNVNILNFLTAGVSPANQELAKLRTEQKPELYTELGFRRDGLESMKIP